VIVTHFLVVQGYFMKSPRVSGTQNGGIDLISRLFRGEDSSFLQVPEHFLMNLLRDAASPITFLLCSRQRRRFARRIGIREGRS